MSRRSTPPPTFNLGELFDPAGRLLPLSSLPPSIADQILSFDVVRVTVRRDGDTVTTEELVRVKLRDRRRAEIAKRGGDVASARCIRRKPLRHGLITTSQRSIGRGRTSAAAVAAGESGLGG